MPTAVYIGARDEAGCVACEEDLGWQQICAVECAFLHAIAIPHGFLRFFRHGKRR